MADHYQRTSVSIVVDQDGSELHFPDKGEHQIRFIGSDASLVKLAECPPRPSPKPNFKAN
jgi:hypothetical protein